MLRTEWPRTTASDPTTQAKSRPYWRVCCEANRDFCFMLDAVLAKSSAGCSIKSIERTRLTASLERRKPSESPVGAYERFIVVYCYRAILKLIEFYCANRATIKDKIISVYAQRLLPITELLPEGPSTQEFARTAQCAFRQIRGWMLPDVQ